MLPIIKKNSHSFTLIEMVIVTALVGLISLATYSIFSSGARIWEKVNRQAAEEDVNIFFDKFTTDLKNSFKFTGIYFSGQEDSLSFPTLLYSRRLNKETVGQVIYHYDLMNKRLDREQRDFSQIYNDESGTTNLSLKNITSLRFRYYCYDEQTEDYFWLEEWHEEKLPLAVSIELVLNEDGRKNTFARTVTIPASG